MIKKFNIMGNINPPMENAPISLEIGLIDCDPDNFFAEDQEIEQKRIELMAEEIKEMGFRSVIEVKPCADRYRLIAGETRLKAMKRLYEETKDPKYQFIPCFIDKDEVTNNQRRRLIMDNLLQRELTPATKMKAIEELQKLYKADKEAGVKVVGRISDLIAKDMGLGKSQVGTYQTVINKGSDAVKSALEKEMITVDAAAKLSKLPIDEQEEYIQQADDLSLNAVNSFIEKSKNPVEEILETNIYDFLDEEDSSEDEQSENDQQILTEVMEQLVFIDDLRFLRTRLHSMDDTALSSMIEVCIEEIQDSYQELLKLLN